MMPDGSKHRLRLAGTALGRPIDPRLRSNVLALAGAAAAGLTAAVLTTFFGDGFSFATAARVGIGVFLGWAVARELSPDHAAAATLALVVAGAMAFADVPALGLNLVALIAIRAWAGTVGHHPTMVDFAGAVGLAAFAGTDPAMWAAGMTLTAGIVAYSPHRVAASATGVVMVAAGVVAGIVAGPAVEVDVSPAEAALLVAVAAAAGAALPIRTVRSLTDRSPRPMSPGRINAGWVVAIASVAGTALFGRAAEAGPLAAAMIATAAYVIANRRAVTRDVSVENRNSRRPSADGP